MENPTPFAQGAINRYKSKVAGIPDCFDCFTADSIRQETEFIADRSNSWLKAAADRVIRAYLDMLTTWYDALDALDSEIRRDVIEGGIPDDDRQYLKQQARSLFGAQQILYRAIAEYHHGSAGPLLDPAYGYAYQLSNSTLSPF